MTNLVVSMLRFSAAFTLYGVEQLENSLKVAEGGEKANQAIEGFEKTLNAVTEVLIRDMDQKKKDTLQSVSKASEDMVHRTMEGAEILDPREVMKVSTDLLQKTSDVTAKWVGKAASAMEKATETVTNAASPAEPQPAPAQ
jgi:hypothetical protein